ncbi:CubicO group peptidase (beta-lactamase class C family) [Nitrobacteraceae bacterium AZCC 2146]
MRRPLPGNIPKSGVYRLRKRLPDDLLKPVGKREEKRSLLTHDPGEAERCGVFAGLGFRDSQKRSPMTEDAIVRLHSMTKPATSLAAGMLVADGELSLDDPRRQIHPCLCRYEVGGEVNHTIRPRIFDLSSKHASNRNS